MRTLGKTGLIVALVGALGIMSGSQLMGQSPSSDSLPTLLDFGSKTCKPCKRMAPILEELDKSYANKFNVVFFDVRLKENLPLAKQYDIQTIPTQIFLDKEGNELWRHTGFLGKTEILAKWKELGYQFEQTPATSQPKPAQTVADTYPNLASAALVNATASELPEGVILRADRVTITQKHIDAKISEAPQNVRQQLRKNEFFLLEEIASRQLLLEEAKAARAKGSNNTSTQPDRDILKTYLDKLTTGTKVSDEEVVNFYNKNKDLVGGRKLEEVKGAIGNYLLQRKQSELVNTHVQTFGKRTAIEVSAPWLQQHAKLAMDNPVDKARSSGKPSLVDFGSEGCKPCEMLAPILKTLKQKYEGKANIVYVSVKKEQILAARYGIRSIPVQVFFDASGKEVYRHTGFWPQEKLEQKLAEIGARVSSTTDGKTTPAKPDAKGGCGTGNGSSCGT